LTEEETAPVAEETPAETASARPGRRFSQMPTWSKEAFSGAASTRRTFAPAAQPAAQTGEENDSETAAVAETAAEIQEEVPVQRQSVPATPVAEKPASPVRPVSVPAYSFRPTVTVPEEKEPELCPNCGNRLTTDTPYCPYCGKRVRTDIEPAQSIHTPVEPAVAASEKPEKTEKSVRPAAKPAAKARPKAEEEEEFFDEETEDDEYDDYDAEEEEDDEEEEERGRKGGTSVVFWILIAVLVLLIGGIGFFLMKSNGGLSGVKSLISGGSKAVATATAEPVPGATVTEPQATEEVKDPNEVKASIEECVMDDGNPGFMIDITAPAGNTVHIITTAALKTDKAQIGSNGRVQIKVPQSVFIPDDYCENEQVSVTPQLELIHADGSTEALNLPDISVTVPALTLTLENPAGDTIEEHMDGSDITVSGNVSDGYAELTVNGKATTIYEGNVFNTTVSQEEERSNGGIIVVELKKKGYATARKSVTVNEFVIKDIEFTVAAEDAVVATDKAAAITGTVTPGATITVLSASEGVICGTPAVTEAGNYSISVTLPNDGIYGVTLKAEAEGYNPKELNCRIGSKPEKLKTFKSACVKMATVYDDVASGALTEQNVIVTGKVTELVKSEAPQVVKITIDGDKVVYVINKSEKKTYSTKDLNKKIEITGAVVGLYEDTGCPCVWGWFATIK